MNAEIIARLQTELRKRSPEETVLAVKAARKYLALRVACLPETLKPGAPSELVRQTVPMQKLKPMLFEPLSLEPTPPRMCYGYPVDKKKCMRIARGLKQRVNIVPYTTSIAMYDAMAYMEKQIGHELEIENVWCEGSDILIFSLCCNWNSREELAVAAKALPKLKHILELTEDPMWYVDVYHPRWTK
ncbi:hypothetical protein CERSUDRAFT_108521 [Gelatoporia subvermispora B]|uniref:Uncharacterized protein n=1 Tax=Ceriporiopsis subvermispora (strain B) TaxID=914234 RepID=M2Q858_CERS8|nr:hypothetical protein CERSUDRAFT_108521 [Gelatoporia subvermispora B]